MRLSVQKKGFQSYSNVYILVISKYTTDEKTFLYVHSFYLYTLNFPPTIEELIEMLKKEMSDIRLFIKPQAVISALAETTGWFIKLYSEIDLKAMQ